jgi:hypothetical protein
VSASSVRAADVAPGFGASLRLAYGVPVGKLTDASGDDVNKMVSGSLPIQLDLGYRFNPNFSAAIFGQYAFGFVASGSNSIGQACSVSGVNCSTSDIRLGAEVFYHALPGQKYDPWVGLGMGYEWGKLTGESGGVSADFKIRGFEFLNVQAGLDFAAPAGFGFGPFVQFTMGQYSTTEAPTGTAGSSTVTSDITNKALHSWIQFGMRGTFNL